LTLLLSPQLWNENVEYRYYFKLFIIILKDNINFEKESKFIVVIPADNPVLETLEGVSKITSKKKRIYAIFCL
jgi:hypothetical protein